MLWEGVALGTGGNVVASTAHEPVPGQLLLGGPERHVRQLARGPAGHDGLPGPQEAVTGVLRRADQLPVRGPHTVRRRREAGEVPVAATAEPADARGGVGPEGSRHRGLPPRGLPRAVRHPGEPQLRPEAPPAAAADVVQSALQGGGEHPRPESGGGGQVQAEEEVSSAEDHLGRRGDCVLLQGEEPQRAQGVLREEPVSHAGREEVSGEHHGADHDPGQQLVQEQEAARPHAAAAQVSTLSM